MAKFSSYLNTVVLVNPGAYSTSTNLFLTELLVIKGQGDRSFTVVYNTSGTQSRERKQFFWLLSLVNMSFTTEISVK